MTLFREGRVRVADGLALAYREYGDPLAPGVPLLCLCGLTRNAADYHDLALRLAGGRRVISLDYRGRGSSDWDPSGRSYRPETYAADARAAMVALGLERAAVCGTSLGGFLAMGLAALAPVAIVGVVLNDAGPDPDLAAFADILGYCGALVAEPPADWAAAKARLKTMLPDIGFRDEATWDSFTRASFIERDGRLVVAWDPGLLTVLRRQPPPPDLWPLFGALRLFPVLLFRGEVSRLLRPAIAECMTTLHPDLRLVTVPGAGHAPTLLEPECKGPIDEFLHRLDRAQGSA